MNAEDLVNQKEVVNLFDVHVIGKNKIKVTVYRKIGESDDDYKKRCDKSYAKACEIYHIKHK